MIINMKVIRGQNWVRKQKKSIVYLPWLDEAGDFDATDIFEERCGPLALRGPVPFPFPIDCGIACNGCKEVDDWGIV